MATVGGMGEKSSVKEGEDSTDQEPPPPLDKCKRNGLNQTCHCDVNICSGAEDKLAKSMKVVKLNGISQITITPSAPTLRSRTEKKTLFIVPPCRKRRSPKNDKCGDYESPSPKKDFEDCVNNNKKLHETSEVLLRAPVSKLTCRLTRTCAATTLAAAGKLHFNGVLPHSGISVPHPAKVKARLKASENRRNGQQVTKQASKLAPEVAPQSQVTSPTNFTKKLDLLHCPAADTCCPSRRYSLEPRDSTEASPRSLSGGKQPDSSEASCNQGTADSSTNALCKSNPPSSPQSPCTNSHHLSETSSPCHSISPSNATKESPLLANQITVKAEIHEEPKSHLLNTFGRPHSFTRQISDPSSNRSSGAAGKRLVVVQLPRNGVVLPPNGSFPVVQGLDCAAPSPDTSRSATPSSCTGSAAASSDEGRRAVEEGVAGVTCCWQDCGASIHDGDLKEHITAQHVVAEQRDDKSVWVCRWEGCKVYNCPSSSQAWLQRHILQHSGQKPFRCIVDGCGQRFASDGALSRHVNSHFNTQLPPPIKAQRSREDTPSKTHKKRTKLKRRKSFLIKTDDYFDSCSMENLRHRMVALQEKLPFVETNAGHTNTVTFHSSVIARRTEVSGKVKVLLHWTPDEILPDTWVPESQVPSCRVRTVSLASLHPDTALQLEPSLYNTHRYRKHRRK